jgi:hypothetical protein
MARTTLSGIQKRKRLTLASARILFPLYAHAASSIPNDCWFGVMAPDRAPHGELAASGPVAQRRVGMSLVLYPTKENYAALNPLAEKGQTGAASRQPWAKKRSPNGLIYLLQSAYAVVVISEPPRADAALRRISRYVHSTRREPAICDCRIAIRSSHRRRCQSTAASPCT